MKGPGTRADSDLDEAEAHRRAGRSAAAVKLFEMHVEGEHASRALLGLALCALEGEHFHRALLHLQTLEELEPDNTAVHRPMAEALAGIGLLERARDEYDKAVSVDPEDVRSWRALARLLDGLDDGPAFLRACEQLLALAPGDSAAKKWLARAREGMAGNAAAAAASPAQAQDGGLVDAVAVPPQKASSAAIASNASPSEAVRELDQADVELDAGRVTDAERLYVRHVESEHGSRALLGLTRTARAQGQPHLALSQLEALEQREPGHPQLAGGMASVLCDLGCFSDAGEHFDRAIAQHPNDQRLWREYASFLQKTGDFRGIVEACQRVLQSSAEGASATQSTSRPAADDGPEAGGGLAATGSAAGAGRGSTQVVVPGLASALAGGVAHTMNGVLTTIMGLASVLEEEMAARDPKLPDVREIIAACQHGRTLTRRLLDFSRNSNMRREPVQLNEIVEGVVALLRRSLPPGISTSLELDDTRPTTVGDPASLAHALQQICANAVEAMGAEGRLSITTWGELVGKERTEEHASTVPPVRYACLRVNDTGCGMDTETLERCFDPLFTATPEAEGAGLGLALVRGMVANHHGTVTIDSAEGVGTTVTLYLPAVERQSGIPASRRLVLVVDDEHLARKAATRQLKSLGYQVLEAKDGKEALSIYRERKEDIAVVLLDLVMPRMDGEVVLDRLVKLDPEVKVLITSGYRRREGARDLIDRGAKGFLEKPYMFAEFRQALELTLE